MTAFTLDPSNYATMVVREATKISSAKDVQVGIRLGASAEGV